MKMGFAPICYKSQKGTTGDSQRQMSILTKLLSIMGK